jgi:surfeit locus 1 family protein
MTEKRRVWPLIVASLTGFCILGSLGIWQVLRLAEKNALIANIDQALAEQPIPLEKALMSRETGQDLNYVAVQATGHFLENAEIRKLTTHDGGPGFSVIAPFLSDDGILVLVDRGTVPESLADPAKRTEILPQGVSGYLRVHDGGQGLYDADNNPALNQWFWWDVPAMLGTIKIPAEARVMDMILHRLPRATESTPPIAPKPKADLRNNHLGYAFTWFGLAIGLAVITALLVKQRVTP